MGLIPMANKPKLSPFATSVELQELARMTQDQFTVMQTEMTQRFDSLQQGQERILEAINSSQEKRVSQLIRGWMR